MKILSISPHLDDSEFGAGALLHRFIKQDNEVMVFGLSSAYQEGIEREFSQSMQILGATEFDFVRYPARRFNEHRQDILDDIINVRDEWNPEVVLCPATDDVHQDHQVVTDEVKRAFKHSTILGYELPWNSFHFKTDVFQVVDKDDIDIKISMVKHYKSQRKRPYSDPKFIKSLARVRGLQAGSFKSESHYAESFELIRTVGSI